MATLHVLRVFCDEAGECGNPLGVFLDGGEVPERGARRSPPSSASRRRSSSTTASAARCRIFTPGLELPFAGHPTVGTAWLLARGGEAVEALRPPAGEVAVRDGRAS